MKTALRTFLGLGLCFGTQSLFSQSAETNPVGFNTVECLPGSDTICGVPFARPAVFQGVVNGTQAGTGTLTITPVGTPGWTENDFQTLYMVRIISGTKAGMYYQVASNAAGTVTVDLAGDTATGINPGDSFRIHPFWTLSTLFPPGNQSTIVESLSTAPAGRRTQVLLPDVNGVGFNLAPVQTFFLVTGGAGWKLTGGADATNEILFPDTYFIVRHNHATITNSTNFTPVGSVELNDIVTPLATRSAGQQDNFVSSGRPIPVKLSDLDLLSSGAFVQSLSLSPGGRRDLLLVFDNSVSGINKAPAVTCFANGGNWYVIDSTGTNLNNDYEIKPSHGVIIRKYANAGSVTSYWKNSF